MDFETVLMKKEGAVGILIFNRPEVLNAVNEQCGYEFFEATQLMAKDDEVRVVIVRGSGRAFCAGIDYKAMMAGWTPSRNWLETWESALRNLESMPKIVIGAVRGSCFGTGFQTTLVCDITIGAEDTRMAIPAVRQMGGMPGMSVWRLPRKIGLGRAKPIILGARMLDAQRALAWGLLDVVVPSDQLDQEVQKVVDGCIETGAMAAGLTKVLMNQAYEKSFEQFMPLYLDAQLKMLASEEYKVTMKRGYEQFQTAVRPVQDKVWTTIY